MSYELPRRILVYGTTGSGKSTLAIKISEATGLPCHLVDELTWEPGWKVVPAERQREIIAEIADQEAWVMDSAYAKWLDLVLPRAELIVGLDYPPPFIFLRLLRRTALRLLDKQPVCNGNVETLRGVLSRNSILMWFFKSHKRKRARMRSWSADPTVTILRFARPSETRAWLESLPGRECCRDERYV